jgi:hypothetical protein
MAKFKGLELLREESGAREEATLHGPSVSGDSSAKVGPRHMGKRQNPAYQQISAYVKRDIYEKVRRELVGKSEDFSDLLDEWMQQWLASKR